MELERSSALLVALCSTILISCISAQYPNGNGKVLTPPYFNLAVGRNIEASSTCGEGVSEEELYCKLTGANPETEPNLDEYTVIQGQLCDVCNPGRPDKMHPPRQAIDGTERWWQSPPLSRGLQYREINLTIDLGQEFHVAYVFIKMANSPRPGVFALERSVDGGDTWLPWQYFADTPSNCHKYFGEHGYTDSILSDDSVVCTTMFSNVVPLEGGEIVVSLVNNRPSAYNFSYSQTLQEWTKATMLRLRLLETKTLQGHLMAVTQQDPTVTRRYFYSIKDISIGGRCVCNGHASVCDKADPDDLAKLQCRCQHNTCGSQCDTCCKGYVQKPWRPATLDSSNECEPCQCYGHTNECVYDEGVAGRKESVDIHGNYEGGGVCQNCRHNTEGINCQDCQFGFFRTEGRPLDDPNTCRRCNCDPTFSTGDCEDGTGRCKCRPEFTGPNCDRCNVGYFGYPNCVPCECNFNGTQGGVCEVGGGQCPCKPNYDGLNCDRCAYGYYNFPECQPCQCDRIGALGVNCDQTSGQCYCNANYGQRDCSACAPGYYSYPSCQLCSCDPTGSTDDICDSDNGLCLCKENFGGSRCERCGPGFFRYPYCQECGCEEPGSRLNECDNNGQCTCNYNFAGLTCDRCATGYYKHPECMACNCDTYGSHGLSCDQSAGQCSCRSRFEGLTCDKCKPNFYIYPYCEECNCNPAGAREIPGYPLGGCGAGVTGRLCECKERVEGKICDTCKPGFYNLDLNNREGCEDCGCLRSGTLGGSNVCDVLNGNCMCRAFTMGRKCDECAPGTYNLEDYHYFGCQDCGCDSGGSLDQLCETATGQCNCRPRVMGRRCDQPLQNHFIPTLYQNLYEMEDGRTESGGAVRYGFDWSAFENYSWRGYAIFSRIQDEVLVDVDIEKPSLYRIVFRFVNPNWNVITADVTLTPQTSTDVQQTSTVVFPPTTRQIAEHVTVSGAGVVSTFVLNPGRWSISLKTPETLFVDYVVLLPQSYYEATVLQESVNRPCTVPADSGLCQHHVYVDVSLFTIVRGEEAFVNVDGQRERTQLYPDQLISQELGTTNMAYLSPAQTNMMFTLTPPGPGKYVLIVKYHSAVLGRTQDLVVDITATTIREQGKFILPGCPYSSLCRQVMTDENRDPKMFEVTEDDTYLIITLSAQSDVDVAIDEIIAIPVDKWDLEYIQARFQCVRTDQQCIGSRFPTPTGSTKAEFESGDNVDRVETDPPPYIVDASIKVVRLDGIAPAINVRITVQTTGPHAFIVHYFQPNHVGFDVDVELIVDGVVYKGSFHAAYCPSVDGCRTTIDFGEEGETIDLSHPDVVIYFNSTSPNPLWVDYVMAVPEIHFRHGILNVLPIDKSAEFIQKCGQDHFYIDSTADAFCQEAVFSLTTDYNNGAISCDCNPEGSKNFACNNYGGQCECRPNVIGRACTQCANGYYDFPNCKQCNCPYGLCDPKSGNCVCPPRVTGENCDTCLPRTFGFDKYIGCEECNCDVDGVLNNNLDCDVNNGQCSCKTNIDGRRCHQCMAGYWNFPRCGQCSCNNRGTTPDVCDKHDARCLCKENVEGPQCSSCKPSTFYLEDRNEKGCTTCFCFGKTTRCGMVPYRRSEIRDMKGWGLSNLNSADVETKGRHSLEAKIDQSEVMDPAQPIYWVAPYPYLGNKITSYGGKLIYTVKFRAPVGSGGIVASDVRIRGNNMTLEYIGHRQPEPAEAFAAELDMLESSFSHIDSGVRATREQFMIVLSNIEALLIRASYYDIVEKIVLTDVQMDVATSEGTGALARNVELCECPAGYLGTSCEQCAPGYYRSLGRCIPCQCNGRTDTCDPETGTCTDCQGNFDGPQCLTCREGYYQSPITGECQICACPMATPSNNFARTCLVDAYGMNCVCKEGYIGARCDSCDLGYWGDPTAPGGSCKPCDCSGNININDPRSCDPFTGECVICINNATGDNCEICADWFYGDAVDLKNCKPCVCDQTGSELCDANTGSCLCKPNVVGEFCDQCMPGTYGFHSGRGCSRCECGEATYSADCDITTGDCECMPGVMGRACDQCESGYWNYDASGCQSCNCQEEGAVTCDAVSGECQCLPGVTGPTCNECMNRWVLVPDEGCLECDSCVHLLLDDVDVLDIQVTEMSEQLQNIHVGVTTIKRLERINTTVYELRPEVDNLISNPTDPSLLDDLKNQLAEIQQLADTTNRNSDRSTREATVVEADASDTRKDAEALLNLTQMATDAAKQAVKFAEDVRDDLINNIASENLEELLKQAEEMLQEIKDRDFSPAADDAEEEFQNAKDALEEAKNLMLQANNQANRTIDLSDKIDDIESRLQDLINSSNHSLDNSKGAIDTSNRNVDIQDEIEALIDQIKQLAGDASMMVDMAHDMLNDSRQFLVDAEEAYRNIERELSKLDQAKETLGEFTDDLSAENIELRPLVDNATEHAKKLQEQADFLDSLISDTREAAEGALNASSAYQTIVEAINNAENASISAVETSTEALNSSNGLAERARKSRERSEELLKDANATKAQVTDELKPRLDMAVENTDALESLNIMIRQELTIVIEGLDNLPVSDELSERARNSSDRAQDAQQRADDAKIRIEVIEEKLPGDLDRVYQIGEDITDINSGIITAEKHVDDAVNLVPQTIDLMNTLTTRAERIDIMVEHLRANISQLEEQILLARGKANQIGVGLNFFRNTTLQVRNPDNIQDTGSYTKLSMYIRTSEADSFLAYVGAPNGVGPKNTDFIALEIIGGYVSMKYDLGTGVAILNNQRIRVDDGEWHHIIAERIGRTGTLTIRTEETPDHIEKTESPGTNSVLDLKPETARFFVGGVPHDARALLDDKISSFTFSGCMEELEFDGSVIGLWNFVEGSNNDKGCYNRKTLQKQPATEFKFDGNGYAVVFSDRVRPGRGISINLDFRTYAEDGILFLGGRGDNFMSVELRGGRVLFQYDLGTGVAQLWSNEPYNDGKWHTVFGNRIGKKGLLKVDDITMSMETSKGFQSELDMDTENMYVGGYSGMHGWPDVTQQGFDGCIRIVRLGTTEMDLNNNKGAIGMSPGCSTVARMVSFDPSAANSYIAMQSINVEENFSLTMKVKSNEENGLLFYVTDDSAAQENALSLSLVEGKILVKTAQDGDVTDLVSNQPKYSDGHWHYISINKFGKEITLGLDDEELIVDTLGKRRVTTTTPLYFGGFPAGFLVVEGNVGTTIHFTGCLGDVTVNGEMINFAQAPPTDQMGVSLAACGIPDPTPPPSPLPSIPPDILVVVTPPPGPDGNTCALDPYPADVGGGADEGICYSPGSRLEYETVPGDIKDEYEFTLDFKTTSPDGLLFYVSDDKHTDFVALYLTMGYLVHAFNNGDERVEIKLDDQTFNDGSWYTAEFNRNGKRGRLTVGDNRKTRKSSAQAGSINETPPYYLGGAPEDQLADVNANVEDAGQLFEGAIRNVKLAGRDLGTADRQFGTSSCTAPTGATEPGVFFHADEGYIMWDDSFEVGLDIDISLEVRPRSLSGVLMSVHNPTQGDYLVLQMVDGNVIFNVDNGGGELKAEYQAPYKVSLCDGEWHSIKVTKAKNVVSMEVDSIYTLPGIGQAGVSSTDTNDPLYFGSVPAFHKGIKTTDKFVGCMRNVMIQKKLINLSQGAATGKVSLDSCPAK